MSEQRPRIGTLAATRVALALTRCLLPVFVLLMFALASTRAEAPVSAELVDVRMIWNQAPHNAFTDLVRWQGRWYCAFREGLGHAGDVGKLRVIVSDDGVEWKSAGLLGLVDYDLRDAALSVMPDDRLMVLGGAQQEQDGRRRTGTFVSYSSDGQDWSAPEMVVPPGRWLWRVTWQGERAYGVAYSAGAAERSSSLLVTRDGRSYETVVPRLVEASSDTPSRPTEARLRFAADGTGFCLHRRDGQGDRNALWGQASPPYTNWQWHDLGEHIGGPNFIQVPGGHWIGAGRINGTRLFWIDADAGKIAMLLRLPSGGDTSYPGMVWHDGLLWMSYYSSHEQGTNIYLARIRLITD